MGAGLPSPNSFSGCTCSGGTEVLLPDPGSAHDVGFYRLFIYIGLAQRDVTVSTCHSSIKASYAAGSLAYCFPVQLLFLFILTTKYF